MAATAVSDRAPAPSLASPRHDSSRYLQSIAVFWRELGPYPMLLFIAHQLKSPP